MPLPYASPDEPPARDLFDLAKRFGTASASGGEPLSRTIPADPHCCEKGHNQQFFIIDIINGKVHTISASLLLVSENAYWYADDAAHISEDDLQRAARTFEDELRPAIVQTIGDIWRPGVDNDPRLTILHTPLNAVAGYFSSRDEFPRSTNPFSNQKEMIYMSSDWFPPGHDEYLSVLVHEFMHAVHWNLDQGEDGWVDEGLAELAQEISGYGSGYFIAEFLRKPNTQLNFWPNEPTHTPPHYGASNLFMAYLAQRYGGYHGLADLVNEQADGVNGINAYLQQFGTTFTQLFEEWVIANYLDDHIADDSIYAYTDRSISVQNVKPILSDTTETHTQPQLSAQYYDLRLKDGDALVQFQGNALVPQVQTACRSGRFCWWSGTGDSIDATLERRFDLSALQDATLEFWMWHDIEEDWDFAYVSVSTDGGTTWTLLNGRRTTQANDLGNNLGSGITGSSGEWLRETMDLSPYTGAGGEDVLLRFEYITDDAVNLNGWLIDDISIPQLGFFDDTEHPGEWQSAGFQRIDNAIPQTFAVQIIEFASDAQPSVRRMTISQGSQAEGQAQQIQSGSLRIDGLGSRIENAVLVIAPTTHATYQPAQYTLQVQTLPPP